MPQIDPKPFTPIENWYLNQVGRVAFARLDFQKYSDALAARWLHPHVFEQLSPLPRRELRRRQRIAWLRMRAWKVWMWTVYLPLRALDLLD